MSRMVGNFGGFSYAYSAQAPSDTQWTERIDHSAVFMSVRFDTQAEFDRGVFPNAYSSRVVYDTGVRSSGNGSVRFEIPSGGGAANPAWRRNFADDYASRIQFGEYDEFYFSCRTRLSAGFVAETFGGTGDGWKQIMLNQADLSQVNFEQGSEVGSCTPLEVVVQNQYLDGIPKIYTNCGDFQYYYECIGQDCFPQPAMGSLDLSFNCHTHPTEDLSQCFPYVDSEWLTCLIKLTLGPLGSMTDRYTGTPETGFINSRVEMWWARDGQAYQKTHDAYDTVFRRGGGATQTTDEEEYGKFWLTPFNDLASGTHQTHYMWFDELLASRSNIHAPNHVPTWVPAEGVLTSVGTNLMEDVDPAIPEIQGTQGQAAVLDVWCGGCYAEDYGNLGALCVGGSGGHGAYFGNEVYSFSFDDLTWRRIIEPTYPWSLDYTNYELAAGVPMAGHSYNHIQYMPPRVLRTMNGPGASAVDVTSQNGALWMAANPSPHNLAGSGTAWAWTADLDGDTGWRRGAASTWTNSFLFGTTCFDDRKSLYHYFCHGNTGVRTFDPRDGVWTTESGANLWGTITTQVYSSTICPDQEVILLGTGNGWYAVDSSGGKGALSLWGNLSGLLSGAAPNPNSSVEWWPRGKCFAVYNGGNTKYFLKPPARGTNWRTNTWQWSNQLLIGTTPVAFVNELYGKFRYASKLDCFVSVHQVNAPVYVFRPTPP